MRRNHWKTAGPLREVYKEAFTAAGLPSYNPHSFRNMLVAEMYRHDLSIAAFKAGSQNLGHEHVLTIVTSYGKVPLKEQGRLIREAFASPPSAAREKPLTRADIKALLRDLVRG